MESTEIEMLSGLHLGDVVRLEPFIASEVKLGRDIWRVDAETNRQRLENYVPTQASRKALKGMLEGTSAGKMNRVHLLTGSYGTGKSYLLLVLANLLGRGMEGEEVETLVERIRKKERRYEDDLSEEVRRARDLDRYLVVVPDFAEKDFKRALLDALRRALEQEGIDYRPRTEYRRASELIERWTENENPVLDELKKRAREDGTSLRRLKAEIEQDYQRESLNRIEEYYKDAMEVGIPYEDVKIEDTYKDVERHIRKKRNFRGISILFDEFGNFLSKFVNQPDSDAGQEIQDFIEFVKKAASSEILLVMAAHRSVADYAKGGVSKKDIEKVSGRFQKKHRLTVSSEFDEAEEMIYNTLVENTDKDSKIGALKKELEYRYSSDWEEYLYTWYPDRDESWRRETIAVGCYPLHPASIRVLPKLSDRVGQSTRTMFKYMSPDEDGGVSSFIKENQVINENENLELLTIDQLYNYFLGNADTQDATGIEAAQIKRRYVRARGNIQVDSPLAERLLKALAILRVVTDRDLQSTGENLVWALNLTSEQKEDARQLLDVLARQGAIRKNKTTGVYKFRGAGEVSVDQIHQRYLQESEGLTAAEKLDIYREVIDLTQEEVWPIQYNDEFRTNRRAVNDYLIGGAGSEVINKWKENLNEVYGQGKGNRYEGNLVVLRGLAKSSSEKKLIKESYQEIDEDLKKYFVLGVSVVGDELLESAVDYEAARKTVQDEDVGKNEDAKEEAVHLFGEYKEALEQNLRRELRTENFEWFYKGNLKYSEGELDKSSFNDFIDNQISRIFNKTPKISNNVVQHYPDGGDYKRKKRRDAMNTFLEREEFSFEGTSQKENMIDGVLKPTGMFKKTDTKRNNKTYVRLTSPRHERASEVWEVLESNLCIENREARLQTAVRKLYHAPYGLSHPAVDMFLAAFVGYHSEEFTLKKGRRSTTLNGKNLSKARAEPSKFSLKYQVLTPIQKRYLKEIRELFGSTDSDENLWVGATQALINWHQQLPEVTKSFGPDEKSGIKKLIDPLREINSEDAEVNLKTAKELLSAALPRQFGLDSGKIEKDETSKDDLIEDIQDAKEETEKFHNSFAEDVLKDIAYKAFDKEYSSARRFKRTVDDWIEGIPLASKHHFKEEGGRAATFLEESGREGKIVDIFLKKIPKSWSDTDQYLVWTSPDERREYVDAVKDVVREIESHQASPVPLLNRISQTAFDEEVSSKDEFEQVVVDWYDNLEPETQTKLGNGKFSDKSNALREAIEKTKYTSGSVVDHFLTYLPRQLNISGGGWPNIPDQGRSDLSKSVEEAVQEVSSWKPPLSTCEMAERLLKELNGSIWEVEDTENPVDTLNSESQKWSDNLPPAIDSADLGTVEKTVLETIRGRMSLQEALETDIPSAVGTEPPSEAISADAGEELIEEVKDAFERIDDWERPMEDLIKSVGAEAELLADSLNGSDVTLEFRDWWDRLDYRPSVSDFGSGSLTHHLVRWGNEGLRWETVLSDLVEASELPEDYKYWSKKQDNKFAHELNRVKERIEQKEPPKPSKEEVRSRVKEALRELTQNMNITMKELVRELKYVINKKE
ncbi:phage pi2 protein 07 [Salinibacter ruber]|uniref:hypothetical protein n=1 Tax=Salinibacter ruber TaxID=146919 RepID=UPI0021673225|nr:hypothetical protein [Salinibacter ruber]MCS4169391.1 phage pi2 protein 07 [Salinibacter ruber]